MNTCFACARRLGTHPHMVECMDEQTVYVGSECFKKITQAGRAGYQPPLGGPKLYLMGYGYSGADNRRGGGRNGRSEE